MSDPLKPELREQIARIIDPGWWQWLADVQASGEEHLITPKGYERRDVALSKADSILPLFEAERGRLVEALGTIAEHPGPNADEAAHWRADLARSALAAVGEGFSSSRDHERSAGSPLEGASLAGCGVAVRSRNEAPIPGEPFVSKAVAEAAVLTAREAKALSAAHLASLSPEDRAGLPADLRALKAEEGASERTFGNHGGRLARPQAAGGSQRFRPVDVGRLLRGRDTDGGRGAPRGLQKRALADRRPNPHQGTRPMSEDLKPCPFCGKSRLVTGRGAEKRAKIRCVDCEATGPVGLDGEASAIAAWNRRSADPQVGPAWRPIESAPKDGTRFLAYQAGKDAPRYECWWQDDWPQWEGWQDPWDNEPEPTHWMPLPAPPSSAIQAAGDKSRDDQTPPLTAAERGGR